MPTTAVAVSAIFACMVALSFVAFAPAGKRGRGASGGWADKVLAASVWLAMAGTAVSVVVHSRRSLARSSQTYAPVGTVGTATPPPPPAGDPGDPVGTAPTATPPPPPSAGGDPPADPAFDPLDAAGAFPNQFTGREHGCDWAETAAAWSGLPMYADKAKLARIVGSLYGSNVTMIVSGTGSGKTVIMPKLAHRAVLDMQPSLTPAQRLNYWLTDRRPPGSVVAITNPKQLTTKANAVYSAQLACVRLGREIGYRHKDSPASAVSSDTRLEYTTDGYLLAVAKSDPDFTEYGVIIIDEAHERPVPTDFLMLALKRAMLRRPDLRVVVMSATIDTRPFVEWFGEGGSLDVGVVEVSGQSNMGIERRWTRLARGETYLTRAVDIVRSLQESPASDPGGVLVFVPSVSDTARGCQLLMEMCREAGLECSLEPAGGDAPSLRCLRLYSGVDEGTEAVAKEPSPSAGTRHVIFSTNVAESSLTVKDLSYVIDSGQVFRVRYDAENDVTVSGRQSVTRAEALQRMGRVGRRRPGVAFLLYPESAFERFDAFPPPSILSRDVTADLFELMMAGGLTWDEAREEASRLLTPPTAAQLDRATAALRHYNLVSESGAPTEVADCLAGITRATTVSFPNALLLLAAQLSGADWDAARFVAMTESGGMQVLGAALERIGKMPDACGVSDHVTALRVFDAARRHLPGASEVYAERASALRQALLELPLTPGLHELAPWKWLLGFATAFNAVACAFSRNGGRCPGREEPLRLQRCDEFFRAVMVAGSLRACSGGGRLDAAFAGRPARGSATTADLDTGVHCGGEYVLSARGVPRLQHSTLVEEGDFGAAFPG